MASGAGNAANVGAALKEIRGSAVSVPQGEKGDGDSLGPSSKVKAIAGGVDNKIMNRSYPIAAGLGALAGLRTMSAPTAVSWAAQKHDLPLKGTPLALVGSAAGGYTMMALAVGELIADKLPFTPSRTSAGPLTARLISGALAGASVVKARKGNWIMGAVLGAAGALAASFAGYELRKRAGESTGIPDPVWAVVEDAVVIGSGVKLASAV